MIDYYGIKVRAKYNRGCLKQPNKLTYDYGYRVNIYIVYELYCLNCLDGSGSNESDPTPKMCSFGEVTWTKNADIEKYGCSDYGVGLIEDQASHSLVVDLVKIY